MCNLPRASLRPLRRRGAMRTKQRVVAAAWSLRCKTICDERSHPNRYPR
jgi:hypothetical protein